MNHYKRVETFEVQSFSTLPNCNVERRSGGPLGTHPQLFFSTIEVFEIIPYRVVKPYQDVDFLTTLYIDKGWSLRRISRELGCAPATVRKKLIGVEGVGLIDHKNEDNKRLQKKMKEMRERGLTLQEIADNFNLWGIKTRTGDGRWHPKTIRDILI